VQQQQGQQCPAFPRPERNLAAAIENFELAKEAELHFDTPPPTVTAAGRRGQAAGDALVSPAAVW
jgi:hypothetical protein